MRYPHIPAQSVVYRFPGPQQPPVSKVIVDRLIRRKVFGQQAPLTTATQDVEDSIHHLAHVGGPRPSTSFCGRNERRQNSPLGIGQISRITCQDHSPRLYPKRQLHDLTTLSRQALRCSEHSLQLRPSRALRALRGNGGDQGVVLHHCQLSSFESVSPASVPSHDSRSFAQLN